MSLINVELPYGNTVKVNADWWYSLSDKEIEKFYELQTLNFDYHQIINDPFDNSSTGSITDIDIEEIEDIDTSIDFESFED